MQYNTYWFVWEVFCEGLAGPNNKAVGETDLDLKGKIELSGSAEVGELMHN